jgi:hypothetical protein
MPNPFPEVGTGSPTQAAELEVRPVPGEGGVPLKADTLDSAFPEVGPPFPEAPKDEPAFPEAEQEQSDQTLSHEGNQPVKSHKEGLQDFGNHVGKDAWEDFKHTVGGILMAPVHGLKNIKDLWKEVPLNLKAEEVYPDQYERPTHSDFRKAYQEHAQQMGDAMVQSWGKFYKPDHWEEDPDEPGRFKKVEGSIPKMIGNKVYHEPTSALLDIMTAVDLGGGVVGALGKASGVRRMELLGDAIRAAPGEMVGKGWDQAKRLMGQNPEAKRLYLDLADEELSAVKPKANADVNAILEPFRELTPEERTLAHEISQNGLSAEELDALQGVSPKVMEAADAYKTYVEQVRQKGLQEFNLPDFTDEALEARLVKQYAKSRYGKTSLSPAEFDEMLGEVRTLKRKPVYVPSEEELKSGLSLEDAMGMKTLPQGKVGFLERYTGGRLAADPLEYVPRVANSFRTTEAKLRLMDRILQEPSLVKAGSATDAATLGDMPVTGVMKKYLDNQNKAKAVYFRQLADKFGDVRAAQMIAEDASIQKRLSAISSIIPDPTVRKLLTQEFYREGGITRKILDTYDRLNQLVKLGATRLNPRYYTGVAVGQALMSLLSGTLPKWGRRARELADFLPAQVQHVALEGGLGQKLLNAIDVHDAMGAATKAGMVTRFAARRISRAADLGFSSAGEIQKVLPDVLQSTRNLSDFQVLRQQLHERMVAKAEEIVAYSDRLNAINKGYTRQIARVKAAKNLAVGELETQAINAGMASGELPEFQRYAELLRPAVREANAFLGSSNALTPVEKYLWRRLVPYYTFNKNITMLAFRLPFIAPTSGFLWSRLSAELNRMTADPALGDQMRGYYPMYLRQDGTTVWVNLQGMSHAGGLGLSHVGGIPVPNMLNPVRANHFLSVGYRLLGGKTEFDIKTVPFGTDEMFVNGHNGEVVRLDENGKPITEIPQLPLAKGIAHMFPWVQYAEHVLQPYEQTTEGWLLNPQAIKKPDGTYRYPYEMMQSLPQIIGPKVKAETRAKLLADEALRKEAIIREIKKAIPKAGPDQREMLIQGLKDYVSGLQQE